MISERTDPGMRRSLRQTRLAQVHPLYPDQLYGKELGPEVRHTDIVRDENWYAQLIGVLIRQNLRIDLNIRADPLKIYSLETHRVV